MYFFSLYTLRFVPHIILRCSRYVMEKYLGVLISVLTERFFGTDLC